jgi:hypothetical protein
LVRPAAVGTKGPSARSLRQGHRPVISDRSIKAAGEKPAAFILICVIPLRFSNVFN